jgi:uncharacterized protein YjbI with pentapeptide repeats
VDIIQPLDLEAGYRTFSFNNKHHLVVTLKLYFPLLGGNPLLFCDAYQEMSKLDTPFLDEGLPKLAAEFFTVGNAISPQEKPVSALTVSTECAGIKKELNVVGDRYWMGGLTGTSSAIPFTKMALNWDNAFGGKGHPLNPAGKGIEKEKTDIGEDLILMPNVEYTHKMMTNKGQTPPAASYMPHLIDHPERSKYLGTYNDEWLATCFPGYPKDFNFKAFNCASSDQQFPSRLHGGENFELQNLHSEYSLLQGTIPKFNARAFVIKPDIKVENLQESDLKEIKTHIDTITFFPNQLMGMVVYRGTLEVNNSDASDYKHLLCAYECQNVQARDKNHYFKSLVGRLHPDLNMQYALTTKDLIPDDIPCGMARLTQQESAPTFLLADHMQKKLEETLSEKLSDTQQQLIELIEQQKKQDLDTRLIEEQLENLKNPIKDEWQIKFEKVIEKLVPTTSDSGEVDLQKIDFKAFDELTKLSEEYADFQKNKAQEQLQQQVQNALDNGNESLANSLDGVLQKFSLPPELPRVSDPEIKLNELKAAFGQQGEDVDLIELEDKLKLAYNSQIESYKMGAHMMDMGTPPLASQAKTLKETVLIAIKNGEKLEHHDLAGIDFSGENLRGVDFSNCYLEQCNFSRTNLQGANLNGAIAARCDFSYANLSSASLTSSNIGACNFNHCDLSHAKTDGCEYGKSDFSYATLTNVNFSNCLNTLEVCFHKSDLSGVLFGEATFIETNFRGANLSECQMVSSTFQKCDLGACHGKQVQLQGSNFIDSNLSFCNFIKSDLTNCRFLDNSSLNESKFLDCILADATLRDVTVERCEFINTTLSGCDFSDSSAKYSIFNGCYTLNSLFIKTDLSHADLSNTNFMFSNFLQANLSQANLSRSNFYGCEFMGAMVAKTDFSRSNLDGTKLENWRPAKWQ